MKKMFSNVLLATAILMGGGALLSSCSDNGDGPDPKPKPGETLTSKFSECVYFGDEHQSKTARYQLTMTTCDVNDEGNVTSAGEIYIIQLYSAVAADPDNAVPAAGTYHYDSKNSFALNTISATDTKVWKINESLNKSAVDFKDLTVEIKGQGVAMTAEATITLSNDTKKMITGKDFNFISGVNSMLISKDVNLQGAMAQAQFLGTLLKEEYGKNSGYYIDFVNSARDAQIRLMLQGPAVDRFSEAAIPTGTLSVITLEEVGETPAVLNGVFEGNQLFGSYYINAKEEKIGVIASGTVTISKTGDSYSINVDCVSSNGFKIQGSYSGQMQMINTTIMSTLTEDHVIDFSSVTSGQAVFNGKTNVDTGTWLMILDPQQAGKEGVLVQLFVESTTSTTIPTGTFSAAETGAAGTYIIGRQNIDTGDLYASLWIKYDNAGQYIEEFAPFAGGTIKIEQVDANYKITFDTVDDNYETPHKLTGDWTGKLTYQAGGESVSTNAVKMSVPASEQFDATRLNANAKRTSFKNVSNIEVGF